MKLVVVVCIITSNIQVERGMGRKDKELSSDVKEVVRRLLE